MSRPGPLGWMTPRQLDWALRARGTVLADWPARDRLAALALLRTSRPAQAILADALARDDEAAPALAGRDADCEILARMQGVLRRRMVRASPVSVGVRYGALAACAAAGLYVGITRAELDSAPDATDVFAAMQPATFASSL